MTKHIYDDRNLIHEMFKYHPLVTEARRYKHDRVNKACQELALLMFNTLKEPSFRESVINSIQQARMLANQYITLEELLEEQAKTEPLLSEQVFEAINQATMALDKMGADVQLTGVLTSLNEAARKLNQYLDANDRPNQ